MTQTTIGGNTFPVLEELKALGGRWNAVEKTWSVPADRADEARKLVAGAPVERKRSAAPERKPRQRREPRQLGAGEQEVSRLSQGRDDGYEIGSTLRMPRVPGGAGPDGLYWTVVAAGKYRIGQEDDVHEGEWRCWAHVRPATDDEAAPVAARLAEAAQCKTRADELRQALRASYGPEAVVDRMPVGARELWGAHRLAGSEAWYLADGVVYYVRSDYDMGPTTWRTTATAEMIAEAKSLGMSPSF